MNLKDIDLNHIAIIMDGNGRWATNQGLDRTAGHAAGEFSLSRSIDWSLDNNLEWLTVFAFSTENWSRPPEEVQFLLNFNEKILLERQDELHERNVRIRFIGRRNRQVPKRLIRRMEEAENLTKKNTGLTFTIAFNYGGRAEIVDAVKQIVDTGMSSARITEKTINRYLYDSTIPNPDLVIRTSGEYRVSNFLLWEIAYSELVFSEVLWPDFRRENLFTAIKEYQDRDRRYGGVSET